MSAYVVSRKTVAAIVRYYVFDEYNDDKRPNASMMANVLMRQNELSVAVRYNEAGEPTEHDFTGVEIEKAPRLSALDCLSCIHCLEYQSSETENWEICYAYKLLQKIKDIAIRDLPGYDKAPWGIG